MLEDAKRKVMGLKGDDGQEEEKKKRIYWEHMEEDLEVKDLICGSALSRACSERSISPQWNSTIVLLQL